MSEASSKHVELRHKKDVSTWWKGSWQCQCYCCAQMSVGSGTGVKANVYKNTTTPSCVHSSVRLSRDDFLTTGQLADSALEALPKPGRARETTKPDLVVRWNNTVSGSWRSA
jgi:hypothetical protein